MMNVTKSLVGCILVLGLVLVFVSSVADAVDWDASLTEEQRLLMCDAQTSGGLLISVPKPKLQQLLSELDARGVQARAVVGEITEENAGRISVSP